MTDTVPTTDAAPTADTGQPSAERRSGADPAAAGGPLFSVLVPVYRTRSDHLREMVDSVVAQTEPSWELLLVDDGSDDARLTADLAAAAAADQRIKVNALERNSGIIAATAAGLAQARGEFVCLLDHDDVLAPQALEWVRAAVEQHPAADVLYTDEDQLHDGGVLTAAFRKPDFSAERLRGQMYLGHLVSYRRSLLDELGGFRPGYDGSQDYDLALRATERAREVVHIPEIAYHWRIYTGSVSHREDNAAVFDAARRALTDHLRRVGIDGEVEQVHEVGVYRVRRRLAEQPLISIVIPTRGSRGFVRGAERVLVTDAVRSIVERSTYQNYEIVLVADTATPPAVLDDVAELAGDRLTVVPFDGPFNFSAKINLGVWQARGDQLLLLNDDVEVITPDWLETMVALSAGDVGMVGAKLLYEDGTVQHHGHLYERGDVTHVAPGVPRDWPGPFADLLVDRDVSGVTAACALLRREVFDAVGGMSLELPVNFNDVDLSLKITGAGYRIVQTPFAELYHFESKSRERSVAAPEVHALRARWDHQLLVDPHWRHDPELARAAVTG
ncbi:glycosyltransferase family 2 protein [Nakamurella aerolata]|uniref:Glycosyltransferase n=1 Tax=Nakamurella aerolata TaxID=1656892 RepID=A0A849A9L3_9ACTN|nr:glycosyltransferase [Nakamurella aerolata]NNG36283.1 glycosyltransferase [Nakamurella aerolata]